MYCAECVYTHELCSGQCIVHAECDMLMSSAVDNELINSASCIYNESALQHI